MTRVLPAMSGVHEEALCSHRTCVVHSPSGHAMSDWPLTFRTDTLTFECACPHGIGHPDPDQFAYWEESGQMYRAAHGCDGCCMSAVGVEG